MITSCLFIREHRHGMPVNVPLDHVFLSFVGEEKSFVPTELRCFSERFLLYRVGGQGTQFLAGMGGAHENKPPFKQALLAPHAVKRINPAFFRKL